MAQAIHERTKSADHIKIHAILAGGHVLSATRAAHDVAGLLASDIEGHLHKEVAAGLISKRISTLIRRALEERLTQMLILDATPPTALDALPVANLKPSDVIERGLVEFSLASLYRYADANRFYCVKPAGQSNGRAFPAWQFVAPVPELLPAVLDALQGSLTTEVHAFLVTAREELNELAPAELLAGKPFVEYGTLPAGQQRLLQLPATERQRRVLAIARHGESVAY